MSGVTSLVSQSRSAQGWHGEGAPKGVEFGMHVDSEISVGAVLVSSDNVSVSVAMIAVVCGGLLRIESWGLVIYV